MATLFGQSFGDFLGQIKGALGADWKDPRSQAIMGLAAGLLSGNQPGQRRATFGEALSRGILGGMQGYQQGQSAQQRQQMIDLQKQQAEAQLAAQQQKLALANQQQMAKSALGAAISGLAMSGPQSMALGASLGSIGPTVANAQRMQAGPGGFDQSLMPLALRAGYSVDDVQKMAGMRDWGKSKVGNYFDMRNPDGTVSRAGTDEFGRVVNTGAVPFKDQSVVDFGGHLYTRDPITNKLTHLGKKTMTPGEQASNQLGWANNAVSRGNLALSQQRFADEQSRGQVIEGQDGFFLANPRTGATRPLMGPNGEQLTKGRPLPTPLLNSLTERAQTAENTSRFAQTFKDEFGGHTIAGDWSNTYGRIMGDSTGQAQWWQDYAAHENVVRNQIFGSAMTETEKREWQKQTITPRMNANQIRQNLQRRQALEARALDRLARTAQAGGYNPRQIEAATGLDLRTPGMPGAAAPGAPMQAPGGGATGGWEQPTVQPVTAPRAQASPLPPRRPVAQGMYNGRKVYRYSDGSIEYAN